MKNFDKMMQPINFMDPLSECYVQEEKLYSYIESYAMKSELAQTQQVLPFAKEKHAGQMRKGGKKIPYIYHPLMVAYHAIALGFVDDDIIAAAILHDVCEDCGVAAVDLPANDIVKTAVALLTKNDAKTSKQYYMDISKNKIATIVKLLDRCNNVSDMTKGFSKDKIKKYIACTENEVYPLLQIAKETYPEYAQALFLMEYHMVSVVTSIKYQVEQG